MASRSATSLSAVRCPSADVRTSLPVESRATVRGTSGSISGVASTMRSKWGRDITGSCTHSAASLSTVFECSTAAMRNTLCPPADIRGVGATCVAWSRRNGDGCGASVAIVWRWPATPRAASGIPGFFGGTYGFLVISGLDTSSTLTRVGFGGTSASVWFLKRMASAERGAGPYGDVTV
jgi:hypothetical protein